MFVDTVVWLSPDKQSRLLISPSVGEGICLLRETQISGLWETESSLALSDEQAIALYGIFAQHYSPGSEAAEDVPEDWQSMGLEGLLRSFVLAAVAADQGHPEHDSALIEHCESVMARAAGELNRRLYQFLTPSPWIRIGETLYNVSQLRLVNRGMPELFEHLNRQAQQY